MITSEKWSQLSSVKRFAILEVINLLFRDELIDLVERLAQIRGFLELGRKQENKR